MTEHTTYFRVEIVEHIQPAPGKEPFDQVTHTETVDSLDAARDVIADHIPVSLDSGDQVNYDHGDHDEMNIGRAYHFWREHFADRRSGFQNHWVDAWVSVKQVTESHVDYDTVLASA